MPRSLWPVFLTVGLLLCLLCPDLSDPSSSTERTSDNQRLGTSNDTTSAAKHPTLKVNWIEVLTIRYQFMMLFH